MIASSMCKAGKVSVSIESMNIVAKKSICLGFWWSWDLSAKVAIEEAKKKQGEPSSCIAPRCFTGH